MTYASGTEIELDEHALTITLSGTAEGCSHGIDYIDYVRQQRVGPVTISTEKERNDFTAYAVPGDCIGFVMGRGGATLRSMEEEWGVLMFFAKTADQRSKDDGEEQLCIFGPLAARRGAELKTMSAVEHKHPGYCVSSKGELRSVERARSPRGYFSDESRPRRGRGADSPWRQMFLRRIAAAPRIVRGDGCFSDKSRPRRG